MAGQAEAKKEMHPLRANLRKLGYDEAHFAEKKRLQKELAPKAARMQAAHPTVRRRRLRQAEDSSDLVYTAFAVLDGLVDGASFEERSVCNNAISSMADNLLSIYDATQTGRYWEMTIYQNSVLDNQSMLYAFCSFEHYQNVIDMLTNWAAVEWSEISTAWAPANIEYVNQFWGAEFTKQWVAVLARTPGWLIEDRKLVKSCSPDWEGKSGQAKQDEQYKFGKCLGRFSTILFDSYL